MDQFYQQFGKRLFDLFFSLFVFSFSWPLFLIMSLLIRLTSPGSIIFKQKRIGKKGQVFELYKFRTMIPEAEQLKKKYFQLNEADGPVFKIKDDPRFINGLGKFLAHTGLDELPNLLNVLKREASWVGPRPLPEAEERQIPPQIRRKRQSILPGITSWWVVKGTHSLSFKKWMELDSLYVKKMSFLTDLGIIIKTGYLCLKMAKNYLVRLLSQTRG